MARWTILQAESYLRELSELDRKAAQALMSRLNVSEREMADWRHAGDLIVRSSFLQDDLVEQFDGFFGLD
jgi:trehalose/maltose hydrolase-like predicted phosphorylase